MTSARASPTSHVNSGDVPQSDCRDFADFQPNYDGRRAILGRPTTFDAAAAMAFSARTHYDSAQAGLTALLRALDFESTDCRTITVGIMEDLAISVQETLRLHKLIKGKRCSSMLYQHVSLRRPTTFAEVEHALRTGSSGLPLDATVADAVLLLELATSSVSGTLTIGHGRTTEDIDFERRSYPHRGVDAILSHPRSTRERLVAERLWQAIGSVQVVRGYHQRHQPFRFPPACTLKDVVVNHCGLTEERITCAARDVIPQPAIVRTVMSAIHCERGGSTSSAASYVAIRGKVVPSYVKQRVYL